MIEGWRLDGPGRTLALAAEGDGVPWVAWFGPSLPPGEDIAALARAGMRSAQGGEIDAVAPASLCPEAALGFPGHPGLIADAPRLRGAGALEDGAFVWRGRGGAIGYAARVALLPSGLVALSASVENLGAAALRLDWLAAPALPLSPASRETVAFSGRWCGEFRADPQPWAPGARLRENRTGRSGHEHFPGLLIPEPGARHTQGAALALHLAWSGGHRMVAEQLPDGRRQAQFGAMPPPGGWLLAPGARLDTPTLLAAWSDRGLNGAMAAFHAEARARLRFARPARPVHYNCWEAVYFRHDPAELEDIAARAAALGAERFVLDDGWFKGRNDDSSSLGDWTVDRQKYPGGLGPLIGHVQRLGMEFGLWVEPEMVSPDSDLFRAHPDWALGPPDQPMGRGQLALDIARAEVSEHLFAALDALLSAHPVAYLKWDHNRVLPFAAPAQTGALYALLDRLRAAHPAVEIESCASGGGRIDLEILRRVQRVWLSDSNDALERLRIQAGAALFLPPEATGSHVGPRVCHTSGRSLPIEFRAWVAAQRHMGFEMDPRELTGAEADTLRGVVAWFKANRAWLHTGRLHRLDPPDPAVVAEMTVAADGARFVVFAGQAAAAQGAAQPLPLTGLEPTARYRVSLRAPETPPRALNRFGHALTQPVVLSGAALTGGALRPPAVYPETMLVLEGARL